MDDQWVEFQKRSKIQEENASVCEQINHPDISFSGITRDLEGQALQWLSTSHRQSSKPGPQRTQHTWWTWHSTECSSAQAKAGAAAAEGTEERLEQRERVGAENFPIMLASWGRILTCYDWYCSRTSEFSPYISGTDFYFFFLTGSLGMQNWSDKAELLLCQHLLSYLWVTITHLF